MSKILFSPVGGTDPISMNNYRDGSMLHIIRYYHPEIVILYMSEEIYRNHLADNRYIYCIDHLCQRDGVALTTDLIDKKQLDQLSSLQGNTRQGECHCIIIKDESLNNPHEYNIFIREFARDIHAVQKNMQDTDELLLNVSSGTPAMKSALLVLSTMLDYKCRMIQVITPEKAMNEHSHRGYDVAFLWEADEDNDDSQNRCQEVDFQSLALVKYQNLLKSFLDKYDYAGALDICSSIRKLDPGFDDRPFRMAELRYLLKIKEARELASKLQLDVFPVRSDKDMKLFEYAVNLFVKAKRNEYVDFIRGLTPLFLPLFIRILRAQTPDHIDIDQYTYFDTTKGITLRKWDRTKLAGSRADDILNDSFSDFRYDVLFSVHIVKLIDNLCPDSAVVDLADSLRGIEGKIRNLAAHEIVSVTPQKMVLLTGYSIDDCIKMIKKAFLYAQINIRHTYWNTYEEMNQKIINILPEMTIQ